MTELFILTIAVAALWADRRERQRRKWAGWIDVRFDKQFRRARAARLNGAGRPWWML